MKLRRFWTLLLLVAIGVFTAHDIVLSTQASQHPSLHTQELSSSYGHTDTCESHALFHASVILPTAHTLFPNLKHLIITAHTYQHPTNPSSLPTYRPPIAA